MKLYEFRRKIGLLMAAVLFIACLMGCANSVNIEYKTVDVIVVDTYYHSEEMIPIYNDGTSTTWIFQPAVYDVKVKYKEIEYTVTGYDTYQRYKNREGETVKGILAICEYDDGSVEYNIVELE